jgi:hypothetical protein
MHNSSNDLNVPKKNFFNARVVIFQKQSVLPTVGFSPKFGVLIWVGSSLFGGVFSELGIFSGDRKLSKYWLKSLMWTIFKKKNNF